MQGLIQFLIRGSTASAAAMLARRSCDYCHPVGMQQQSLSGQEPVHFTLVELQLNTTTQP
jgi:hypothetical protein